MSSKGGRSCGCALAHLHRQRNPTDLHPVLAPKPLLTALRFRQHFILPLAHPRGPVVPSAVLASTHCRLPRLRPHPHPHGLAASPHRQSNGSQKSSASCPTTAVRRRSRSSCRRSPSCRRTSTRSRSTARAASERCTSRCFHSSEVGFGTKVTTTTGWKSSHRGRGSAGGHEIGRASCRERES